MSLKFYTDTHIAKQVAVQLRQRGVDIVRCEEVGMAAASDEDHLAYAAKEKRVLVSMDDDFTSHHTEWLAEGKQHAGIMYVASKVRGEAAISLLVTELYEYFQLIEAGAGTLEQDIYNRLFFI